MSVLMTFDMLYGAYEKSLRAALTELLGGDDSILPPLGATRDSVARNVVFLANALYNDELRRVRAVPRELHLSTTFLRDPRRPQFEPKLSRLLAHLKAGDEAVNDPRNRFLSPTVEHVFWDRHGRVVRRQGDDGVWRPQVFQDYMLYDWGVHHFHIEEPRGAHLLFALLQPSRAYIVQIGTHGSQFDDPGVLEVVNAEWPGVLHPFDGLEAETDFTPAQIRRLRRGNVNFGVQLASGVLSAREPRATDGTPVRLVDAQSRVARHLRRVASGLVEETEPWARAVLEAIGGPPDEVQVCIRLTPEPVAESLLLGRDADGPWIEVCLGL